MSRYPQVFVYAVTNGYVYRHIYIYASLFKLQQTVTTTSSGGATRAATARLRIHPSTLPAATPNLERMRARWRLGIWRPRTDLWILSGPRRLKGLGRRHRRWGRDQSGTTERGRSGREKKIGDGKRGEFGSLAVTFLAICETMESAGRIVLEYNEYITSFDVLLKCLFFLLFAYE